jgi:hypothetical protein
VTEYKKIVPALKVAVALEGEGVSPLFDEPTGG